VTLYDKPRNQRGPVHHPNRPSNIHNLLWYRCTFDDHLDAWELSLERRGRVGGGGDVSPDDGC